MIQAFLVHPDGSICVLFNSLQSRLGNECFIAHARPWSQAFLVSSLSPILAINLLNTFRLFGLGMLSSLGPHHHYKTTRAEDILGSISLIHLRTRSVYLFAGTQDTSILLEVHRLISFRSISTTQSYTLITETSYILAFTSLNLAHIGEHFLQLKGVL